MIFDVELINLILYCAQQLGVALGLGAQTIMLVAYVGAVKDGNIDEHEAQFLRATRAVLWVSLVLILLSGAIISAMHFMGSLSPDTTIAAYNKNTLFSSAYLFKTFLIVAVIALTALLHKIPETFAEGLLGGTWYALFLVHILAPVTSWTNLFTLLLVWLIGFMLVWYGIIFATGEKAAVLKPNTPVAIKPKAPRKPFFSFFTKVVKPGAAPAPTPEVVPAPAPLPVTAPAPKIALMVDSAPKTTPLVVPDTQRPQIKTDAVPVMARTSLPIEKLPANKTTDTPFLPQVPPLQPIPTIPPMSSAQAASAPAAGIPKVPGAQTAPILQKPEELSAANETSPQIRLGIHVMPQSPDQIK